MYEERLLAIAKQIKAWLDSQPGMEMIEAKLTRTMLEEWVDTVEAAAGYIGNGDYD